MTAPTYRVIDILLNGKSVLSPDPVGLYRGLREEPRAAPEKPSTWACAGTARIDADALRPLFGGRHLVRLTMSSECLRNLMSIPTPDCPVDRETALRLPIEVLLALALALGRPTDVDDSLGDKIMGQWSDGSTSLVATWALEPVEAV